MTPMIVGLGLTKFGRHENMSLEDLIHSAGREALDSAGIQAVDVDAIWFGHSNPGLVPDGFCSSMALGITRHSASNHRRAAKMPACPAPPHFMPLSMLFAAVEYALLSSSELRR